MSEADRDEALKAAQQPDPHAGSQEQALWRQWLHPKALSKLIGIGIFAALVQRFDWRDILETLRTVRLEHLLLAMAAMVLSVSLKALRWRSILRPLGVDLTPRSALAVYYGAFYIGLLTPGRMGEIIKAFYLQRVHRQTLAKGTLSVMVDRVQDVLALVVACLATSIIYREMFGWGPVIALSPIALALLLPCLMPGTLLSLFKPMASLLHRLTGVEKLATIDYQALAETIRKGVGWQTWLLTTLSYAGFFGVGYALTLAMGLELSPIYVVFMITASSLLSLLPITVSGIGTRDVAMVYFFGRVGLGEPEAIAFSLLVLVTCYLLFAFIGFIVWMNHPLPLAPAFREREADVKV